MSISDEWNKVRTLRDKTIKSLVLSFNEPIFEDYTIPSSYKIGQFAEIAIRRLCGVDKAKEKVFMSEGVGWFYLKNVEVLQKRVKQGLMDTLGGPRYEYSSLDLDMICPQYLERVWVFGYGDLYKFLEGERERTEAEFTEFWNLKEQQNFLWMQKIIRSHAKKDIQKRKSQN